MFHREVMVKRKGNCVNFRCLYLCFIVNAIFEKDLHDTAKVITFQAQLWRQRP